LEGIGQEIAGDEVDRLRAVALTREVDACLVCVNANDVRKTCRNRRVKTPSPQATSRVLRQPGGAAATNRSKYWML
jgi:hypothetical protein